MDDNLCGQMSMMDENVAMRHSRVGKCPLSYACVCVLARGEQAGRMRRVRGWRRWAPRLGRERCVWLGERSAGAPNVAI